MQILAFDFGTQVYWVCCWTNYYWNIFAFMSLNVAQEGEEIWSTIQDLINEWKPDQIAWLAIL